MPTFINNTYNSHKLFITQTLGTLRAISKITDLFQDLISTQILNIMIRNTIEVQRKKRRRKSRSTS